MKKWILTMCLLATLLVAGCGSSGADIGFGAGLGALLSNTIAGGEKDLIAQEQRLIDLYNQGVEQGMAKEGLDQIEQDIRDTRLTRQTLDTGKGMLDVDWSDSKDVGGAVGGLAALAMLWMRRKDKKKVVALESGISKFEGTSDPATAAKLHDILKVKTANL